MVAESSACKSWSCNLMVGGKTKPKLLRVKWIVDPDQTFSIRKAKKKESMKKEEVTFSEAELKARFEQIVNSWVD